MRGRLRRLEQAAKQNYVSIPNSRDHRQSSHRLRPKKLL